MHKTSDIFAKAIDRIRPEGAWTRSVYARDGEGESVFPHSPLAVCYCIDGALTAEIHRAESLTKGREILVGQIEDDLKDVAWGADIRTEFNDTHTQAEVIAEAEGVLAELRGQGR